ncbi:MAG: trypsin-like peptidase domain-containing protein [Myxococcaceae bacterium]|nr:trypsin-like peptidase domain-containing protein [Myxococcaceae bacterium]
MVTRMIRSSVWAVLLVSSAVFAQGKDALLPSLAPLVEQMKAAVVNVDVQAKASGEEEQMERFMGRSRGQSVKQGAGSGFIFDSAKGLVLTNNHVVEGAITIRVRLDDGRTFDAETLGRDPLTDVAVVKLKGKIENLPAARLGDSSSMRVGDWVIAIGNPFGLASSVSLGIISALDRNIHNSQYDQFLQTDAAINPGNSGGPLFNMKGEVIGINTAIVGGGTGIGFAIPSNLAKALVPQLQAGGAVVRGWLGVGYQDLSAGLSRALGMPATETGGAIVTSVNDGSPAKKAGVQLDDVVVELDGEKVSSGGVFARAIALKKPESTVALKVYRNGKPIDLKVKLGTRPDLPGERTPKADPGEQKQQQRIGLAFQEIDPRVAQSNGLPAQSVWVVDVVPGSPADRAGFRRGMVVTEFNRKPVRGRDDLVKALSDMKPGQSALIRVMQPEGGRTLLALELS